MLSSFAFLCILAAFASANICTTPDGHWSFEMVSGVTDFAYTGVALNDRYFCFFGCLLTKSALQNYKVLLANGSQEAPTKKIERQLDFETRQVRLKSGKDDQSEFCPDPYIENTVKNAINQAVINNATSIANTILLRLNRGPGWAVVVVGLSGGGVTVNGVFPDWNFCDYDAFKGEIFYNVKVAKIDMS